MSIFNSSGASTVMLVEVPRLTLPATSSAGATNSSGNRSTGTMMPTGCAVLMPASWSSSSIRIVTLRSVSRRARAVRMQGATFSVLFQTSV